MLPEHTNHVSPRLQPYTRKGEELLIPCNLVPSVQSGGHAVLLDKCTPASTSTVYSTRERAETAQVYLTSAQSCQRYFLPAVPSSF